MKFLDWIGKSKADLLMNGIGDGWNIVCGVTGGAGWCSFDGPDNGSASFFWGIDGIINAVNDGSGIKFGK